VKHSQIGSAKDFIEKAASTSSLSGEPYLVRCQPHQVVHAGQRLKLLGKLVRIVED
jgi:hypothetical protein